MASSRDLESPFLSDAPRSRISSRSFAGLAALLLLGLAAAYSIKLPGTGTVMDVTGPVPDQVVMDRGLKAGVSAKSSGPGLLKEGAGSAYAWTNEMLSWQRTGFHFQPEKNWMNDPNGPMYYNGWYHFFYQYNELKAVWGNISWGHAVSKDLLNWIHLPLAMRPDHKYDNTGVWSGSATILPDGQVKMLYTGLLNGSVQVQNLAVPSNLSDPFLRDWTKVDSVNPVMMPPPGIGNEDFRDPSTAWFEPSDSTWRITIGSKDPSNKGIALVYSTADFITYTLLPGYLHSVNHVGMWECIDFYPIATAGAGANHGLDPSASGPTTHVRHVLKASTSDNGKDYYAVGTYDPLKNKWVPDDKDMDVGIGLRYDWGNFYASKTFYDEVKQRRVLWGWIKETDRESVDISKGWASLQSIPRTVLFDLKTGNHLLTWPIEEVENLRSGLNDFSNTTIAAGASLELGFGGGAQLDIVAEFEINIEALEAAAEEEVAYDCRTSGGAANRGVLGPFGLLVLANQNLTEQTATYFYVSKGAGGNLSTHFCQDESRSSMASGIIKSVVGHTVPVLNGETLSLRILVDHSIVESFAQGGRASVTSRVYLTETVYNTSRVFLFNNATHATVTAQTLKVWHMNSTVNSNLLELQKPQAL